jgi:hypothetical protein
MTLWLNCLPPTMVFQIIPNLVQARASQRSPRFFADKISEPNFGAWHLVASKAFDHNAETFSDKELPYSTSKTYVYLLISSFMLTLTQFQYVTIVTILSLLIPNAIKIGKSGRPAQLFPQPQLIYPPVTCSHAEAFLHQPCHFHFEHRCCPYHPQSKGKWNSLFIFQV